MKFRFLICLELCLASASAAHADITIDSFQDPEGPISANFQQSEFALTSSFPHVIGGRGLGLSVTTGALPGANPITAEIITVSGASFLQYQSQSADNAGDCRLNYGGSPSFLMQSPQPMGLGVNSASDILRLSFSEFSDARDQSMEIDTFLQNELETSGTAMPSSMSWIAPGAQIVDIPLTGLTGDILDFITFDFRAPLGATFQLNSVSLVAGVPEPSAICLAAAGLSLLIRRRRL
jgi:hypothetical protein